MDRFVEKEGLKDTFPYLDNITVAGHDQNEHDENVKKLREAIQCRNVTLNENETVESKSSINLLGYCFGNGIITPDQERLCPLKEFLLQKIVDPSKESLGCLHNMQSGYPISLTKCNLYHKLPSFL